MARHENKDHTAGGKGLGILATMSKGKTRKLPSTVLTFIGIIVRVLAEWKNTYKKAFLSLLIRGQGAATAVRQLTELML